MQAPSTPGTALEDPTGWFLHLLDRRLTPCWLIGSDGGLAWANRLAGETMPPQGAVRHLADLLPDPDGRAAVEAALQLPDRPVGLPTSMRDASGRVWSGSLSVGRLACTPLGPMRVASFDADGPAAWLQPKAEDAAAAQPQPAVGTADAPETAAVIAAAFAVLGHEIRTPLNAVLGFAELLRRDLTTLREPLRSRCLGHVKRIADAGAHLLSMSKDLLDPSANASNAGLPAPEPLSLSALFDAAVALTQDRFAHHQVQLALEPDGRSLQVLADLRRSTQVLCNLLTNAAKYTPAGGRAILSASRVEGAVRIAVLDNGPGIDAAGQARLFHAYERLGLSDEHVEGHGLGLFVSRQLVTAMNGRIGCVSEPGAGTEFWFELPAA